MTDLQKRGAAKPIVTIILFLLLLVVGFVLIKESAAKGQAQSLSLIHI